MRIAPLTLMITTMAAPALAQDYQFFQAPSGNIACAIFLGDGAAARCDIRDYTPSFPVQPADCDLDWGGAFVVGLTGPGQVGCVGDTVNDPGAPVLAYGQSLTLGPFTCQSAETGMTCQNGEGHGFTIARAAQRVF